jgi:hypothetical protein
MANIAAQMVANEAGIDEELGFAVVHAYEMLSAFKESYYARWHGEKKGP